MNIKTEIENIDKQISTQLPNIEENLLFTKELQSLQKDILEFLDKNIHEKHPIFLKYRKFKKTLLNTLWSNEAGYPFSTANALHFINPWINFFYEYVSFQTIKQRLEYEGLFVESRTKKNDDLHILVGENNNSSNKAHIIIDNNTAEIRVEDNQDEPTDYFPKIEAILTLKNGRKIKSTRESLDLMTDENNSKLTE